MKWIWTYPVLRVSPGPLHQLLSKISNFGTIPYKFDIPFHIKVQKITLPNTDYAHKISQVISVKHVQHSIFPEDGS